MIQVYIALAVAAVAFGAGWKVCDWRNDAQKVAVEAVRKLKAGVKLG